ncbi:MAG: polyprenyl diphosphate synthase [Planctomycetota bacterium]|nr:polyprenyl diphosphate synthase [Planctomycetota bacterium]
MTTATLPSLPDQPVTPLHEITDQQTRAVVERMRRVSPKADPTARIPDVPPGRVPRHVAIIMDGNGRWARDRGFPRAFGHRNGAAAVRRTLDEASRLGIEYVTLFSFSSENWKRPADEVRELMQLYLAYMAGERAHLVRENIRLIQIGRREGLPQEALAALDETVRATSGCTGPTLCLAVNYGARAELADAARSIAQAVRAGTLRPEDVDERAIEARLGTAGLPDPDLLIRTAGEMRISNFLLWQISYAELYVTDVLWPDFSAEDLRQAVRAYAARRRRFGALDESVATDEPASSAPAAQER